MIDCTVLAMWLKIALAVSLPQKNMALEGKTPAQAVGLTLENKNKWLTLIRNAKLHTKVLE